MDVAVLKLTDEVPVSAEEMCSALNSEVKPVMDAVSCLLESGEIIQRIENGTAKYIRRK